MSVIFVLIDVFPFFLLLAGLGSFKVVSSLLCQSQDARTNHSEIVKMTNSSQP